MKEQLSIHYFRPNIRNFGVTRTRRIFEKAIEKLKSRYVKQYGLRYAKMERRLGEIDRARAIYAYIAQFCPVDKEKDFWEIWKNFEGKEKYIVLNISQTWKY